MKVYLEEQKFQTGDEVKHCPELVMQLEYNLFCRWRHWLARTMDIMCSCKGRISWKEVRVDDTGICILFLK
jgi:hypothetical protein